MLMNSPSVSILFLFSMLASVHTSLRAQDQPEKYGLLVGVTNYEKPELNTGLKYPEKDAEALAAILRTADYKVDLLLGEEATAIAIRAKLGDFSKRGGNKGVVFVALCGHGTEFADTKRSYFCPYDTSMKALRDKQGQALFDKNGNPMLGPTAESMVAIDDILLAFGESKAAHRILVADCCRDDANRARGRSFGTSLTTDRLPIQTLMLLGCSPQEQSLEHDVWQHGALTKCLLDQLELVAKTGKGTMGGVAEEVLPAVELLVRSQTKNFSRQTPRILSTGRVELLFPKAKLKFPPQKPTRLLSTDRVKNWLNRRVTCQIESIIEGNRRFRCVDLFFEEFQNDVAKGTLFRFDQPVGNVRIEYANGRSTLMISYGNFGFNCDISEEDLLAKPEREDYSWGQSLRGASVFKVKKDNSTLILLEVPEKSAMLRSIMEPSKYNRWGFSVEANDDDRDYPMIDSARKPITPLQVGNGAQFSVVDQCLDGPAVITGRLCKEDQGRASSLIEKYEMTVIVDGNEQKPFDKLVIPSGQDKNFDIKTTIPKGSRTVEIRLAAVHGFVSYWSGMRIDW